MSITLIAAKFIIEVLQQWTIRLKQFIEWKAKLVKYLSLIEDMCDNEVDDEVPAKRKKLENEDEKAEADFSKATQKLVEQILEMQEMLDKQLKQIHSEEESYAEYLAHSFRNVPRDKQINCFTECMEIILKHRKAEEE